MTASALNPYQPPQTPTTRVDGVPIDEIDFVLTSQNLRYGLSHHLLRCRPIAVSVVSVLMIGISLVVFSYTALWVGSMAALLIMPLVMAISACVYQYVIRKPRRLTHLRMAECGLIQGARVSIKPHPDHLIVQTLVDGETNAIRWEREGIKRHRTPLGLMIVPEQYVFLFLPSRGQFDQLEFQSILELFPQR